MYELHCTCKVLHWCISALVLFPFPQLEVKVANITLLIEQEVTEPSLRTFPALSLMMGKYSSTALVVKLQDWSSKVKTIRIRTYR